MEAFSIRVEQVRWCTALTALQLIQGVLLELKFEQLSDSRFRVGHFRDLCSMEFEWFPEKRIRCYFHFWIRHHDYLFKGFKDHPDIICPLAAYIISCEHTQSDMEIFIQRNYKRPQVISHGGQSSKELIGCRFPFCFAYSLTDFFMILPILPLTAF